MPTLALARTLTDTISPDEEQAPDPTRRQDERARAHVALLVSLGEVLADARDLDAALAKVPRLAVPSVADWAALYRLERDGGLRLVAMEHGNAELLGAVRDFVSENPPTVGDRAGVGAVVATGRVELLEDFPRAWPRLRDRLEMPDEARRLVDAADIRSMVTCPIQGDERMYGAISLATTGERTYTAVDAAFATELGRRIGAAIDKVRLHARLDDRLRGQQAVARLGQAALLHAELEPLFDATVRDLAHVLDADMVAVMRHDPERHALRIVAGHGWRDGVVGEAMISDSERSHSGFAFVSDGPVVSVDYLEEKRFRPSPLALEHKARSGVTTPIHGPDGPWGVLGVHSRSVGHFDPEQVALLDTFANVLGSAIGRNRAVAQLRDRDERLELALAVSRTGFWEWNVQTGRIVWSAEVARLHGVEPGHEPTGLEAYLAQVHPDDREMVQAKIAEALEGGAYDVEFRLVLPDGRVRWTHATAKLFYDAAHKPLRMIGVARDVTERVQMEAERRRMEEAERRASELGKAFIGIVSHELRTPITSIFAGSKLLRRLDESASDKRAELTADIEAEAERLYRLTEDLLVLTRVERGGLEIEAEPVSLPRVLERVIASEQERWPLTTIELMVQPGVPFALGDNTYIEQLVRNLVGNAAKYAPAGGTIQVVATATQKNAPGGQRLEVRVLDRGPGLAEDKPENLFELFYRSPLTAKKAPGAGIGLFVCNQLARAMGGRLWASNREGGGAEFGFSLQPYVADATSARRRGAKRGGAADPHAAAGAGVAAGAGAGAAAAALAAPPATAPELDAPLATASEAPAAIG